MRVMETKKMVLEQEHPSTLTSMANLASTYQNQGRWKDAEELEVQVTETRKTVEHPSTLASMGNLASVYSKQRRWKEAEELQAEGSKGLDISQRVLGKEHPNTLLSMHNNLATIFKGQGRDKEAMTLMEDCTRMQKRVLGPDHPSMTSSQSTLTKWQMGNLDSKS